MTKISKLSGDECSAPMEASNWSSLPFDLIHRIGEIVQGEDDIDHYIDFRAVCSNWRRATADPMVSTMDFLPNRWIMLEQSIEVDCSFTLVNVSTGRFLPKCIPLLHHYLFVGASHNGLLVLGEGEAPHETRVLNPFTGTIFKFRAPVYREPISGIVVTSSPMMVFIANQDIFSVSWIDQTSRSFKEGEFRVDCPNHVLNITPFTGEVHVTNHGSIISTAASNPERRGITMHNTIVGPNSILNPYVHYYLVESDGDLLLVSAPDNVSVIPHEAVVYKVDTVSRTVTPVRSIGNRAIFLSCNRCLSVDARKFHTVQPGSIYYVEEVMIRDANPNGSGWGEAISDLSLLCPTDCYDTKTLVEFFAYYCISIDELSGLH